MKIIKRELSNNIDKLTIIPISDVHIGDKTANLKAFREVLERIKNEPNTYAIVNGDICNFALKNSKSDVYEGLSPMNEILEAIKYLEQIKEKLLIISSGNHEDRLIRETNVDPLYLVSKQLGLEDIYCPSWWYLYLSFGKDKKGRNVNYTLTGYHGGSGMGGRKSGGKINRLEEMSQVVIADIYLMGHVHKPIATKGVIFTPYYQSKTLSKQEMYYLISNSFVEYEGSYAEKMGMIPSNNGITEAVLDGKEKQIKLVL